MNIPIAPEHLSGESKTFWQETVEAFNLDAHHLKELEAACTSLDRIAEARAEVEKAGAYFTDRFGQPKEHPGMKVERDNKILFARLIRELGLDLEQPETPRPPSQY